MALTHWKIDPARSRLTFTVRHLMVTRVQGTFRRWRGEAEIDPDDLSRGRVEISVDVESVDTGFRPRDDNLRSADFFDAQKFAQLRFRSTGVKPKGRNRLALEGELEMRGVVRPVVVEAELLGRQTDPSGPSRLSFAVETAIYRKQWRLEWSQPLEVGGALVSDQVQIKARVEFLAA
jgi:polyisoprenoid-binding protein YceI